MINDERQQLSPADLERVDAVCDAFLNSWNQGERPRLEALISDAPESLRRAIALELIQSEIECRQRAGELPTSGAYAVRFPQWALELESRFAELPQTADASLEATQLFARKANASDAVLSTTCRSLKWN